MTCLIENCDSVVIARGLCRPHYRHLQHFNSLDNFPTKRREWGQGTISKWGYKIIAINKKQVLEHRYLIEEKIGRKLKRHESVHHINGDKLDNRISNLELITQSEHINIHRKSLINGRNHDGLMILDWSRIIPPKYSGNKNKKCFINKCKKPAMTIGLCGRHKQSYYHWKQKH